ncbi:MAG: DUF3617 family protein [Vicinamibacterales bacterium]
MTRSFRSLGFSLLALSLTAVVLAQTPVKPALDLRMGLWEVTTVTTLGGASSAVDSSKMTPEQRAAMAGALGSRTSVSKTCMTTEKLTTQLAPTQMPGTTCTQAVKTNTRTLLENTMTCTGQRASTSVSRTEAPSSTSFKGSVTSNTSTRGRDMAVTLSLTGKWLGADCGDVK